MGKQVNLDISVSSLIMESHLGLLEVDTTVAAPVITIVAAVSHECPTCVPNYSSDTFPWHPTGTDHTPNQTLIPSN